MICDECKGKSVLRGLKLTKCIECGLETMINFAYSDICNDCSDKNNICQYCGVTFVKQVEYFDITKQGE